MINKNLDISQVTAAMSSSKDELLAFIRKQIDQGMESDRKAQIQYQNKMEELKRSQEINEQLRCELTKVRVITVQQYM